LAGDVVDGLVDPDVADALGEVPSVPGPVTAPWLVAGVGVVNGAVFCWARFCSSWAMVALS